MLWNGFANGGSPAFADIHTVVLHPLVVVTTLLCGAINGVKVTIVASLVIAGLAQWWLAKVLGLGRLARVWSACLAVAGGHLAGKMEDGMFPLIVALASVSLVFATGLKLALSGRRRDAVPLGLAVALALVSGQGYMQLGMVLAVFPSFLVFLLDGTPRAASLSKGFALAGLLAILLAAILWVPFLHYLPEFTKDMDPSFRAVQTIEYAPLNLVIRDMDYYKSEALGKQPFPFVYANYIGWVPVLFAIVALRLIPRSGGRMLTFLLVSIGMAYVTSSGLPFKLMAQFAPNLAYGVRNSPLIAGVAVPPLLALAAWGLDRVLALDWPRITWSRTDSASPKPSLGVSLSGLVLALPLIWSLKSAHDFGQTWLKMGRISDSDYRVVQLMQKPTTQWLMAPFGEHYWTPMLADRGLKATKVVRPWHWRDREIPGGYVEATRGRVDASSLSFVGQVEDIKVFVRPENEYACVHIGSDSVPCRAVASGGRIRVDCDTDAPGTLVVKENQWSGWSAKRDGTRVALGAGQWLNVPAPPGRHRYEFRYRPWDVVLGLILTLSGTAVAIWLWFGRSPHLLLGGASDDI